MRIPDLELDATFSTDDVPQAFWLAGGERRSPPLRGTRALMLAVLEDGIRAYLGSAARAREEAERWITSQQRRVVFSFNVVCETLGLEPNAVRAALRRMRTGQTKSELFGRARPNVRRALRRVS